MIDYIVSFQWNGVLAIALYWAPLGLNAYGYTLRTWRNYRRDVRIRMEVENEGKGHYYPTDTVGSLIGRALASVVPIANLWAASFDVGPEVFQRLFDRLGLIFNQPVVPRRAKS